MANNTVFIMEAANLFCGSLNADDSNHLTISDLKLPGLEESYVDHVAGGAPIAIEIETHMTKLEATFNLLGWNTRVMTMIGTSARVNQVFTAYGVIRDRRSGATQRAVATMLGRLGRVNPQPWRRGDAQHHEYAIRGIVNYKLELEGTEIYYWDFFTNERRIGGVDQNTDTNVKLGIVTNANVAPPLPEPLS